MRAFVLGKRERECCLQAPKASCYFALLMLAVAAAFVVPFRCLASLLAARNAVFPRPRPCLSGLLNEDDDDDIGGNSEENGAATTMMTEEIVCVSKAEERSNSLKPIVSSR